MRRTLSLAACAAAPLLAPAAATAASVHVSGTRLIYTAAAGEVNTPSMTLVAGGGGTTVTVRLDVVEPLLAVTPGAGCAPLAPDDASCTLPATVEIRLGNGNDATGTLYPVPTLLDGGSGNDRLVGPNAPSRILGGSGRDRIKGGIFNDRIDGGSGNDRIDGGGGRDRILGGSGNDRLNGAGGNDVIVGGPGRDLIGGGPGNDRIDAADGRRDIVGCGPGFDTVRADRSDVLFGCERVRYVRARRR